MYNIIGGNMKIRYNYENYLNVIMTAIFFIFFIVVAVLFFSIVSQTLKFTIEPKYYAMGITIFSVIGLLVCFVMFVSNYLKISKNKKIMAKGEKTKGKLVKINGDYINGRIYYSIEVDINGTVKKIENIANTKFVRNSCLKGGYVRNDLYYVDVYVLDKDYYVDFKSIRQGKEF